MNSRKLSSRDGNSGRESGKSAEGNVIGHAPKAAAEKGAGTAGLVPGRAVGVTGHGHVPETAGDAGAPAGPAPAPVTATAGAAGPGQGHAPTGPRGQGHIARARNPEARLTTDLMATQQIRPHIDLTENN